MWRPQRSELVEKLGRDTGNKKQQYQSGCIKRLLRDLKQIRESSTQTVGVAALPLEKNLRIWHANIRGPKETAFEGGVFHLILDFPESYPYEPPSVTICTPIPHPNVIGGKLCLDMLNPGQEQDRYAGWSSAYSVQSILIQLQAFLFEDSYSSAKGERKEGGTDRREGSRDRGERGGRRQEIKTAIDAAQDFSCITCPHKPYHHWPEIPPYNPNANNAALNHTELKMGNFTMLKGEQEIVKSELVCFYSKRNFNEDVLGIGVNFSKNIKNGEINSINPVLDLVGIKAFMRDQVRKGVFKEPFQDWFPIYINAEHGAKAFHLGKKAISMICKGDTKHFSPEQALVIFPKLMSTMVVNIMKGSMYHSIRALEGYCMFHRMFIKFLTEYPELLATCEEKVSSFLSGKTSKDDVSNLGDFLTLLSVVFKHKWSDIVKLIIPESLARQVLHLVATFPKLEKEEEDPSIDKERDSVTFEATLVSSRLVMFHMYFLEQVVKNLGPNLEQIAHSYDQNFGRPANTMIQRMQDAFNEIIAVKDYNDYFDRIGYSPKQLKEGQSVANQLTKDEINAMLRDAVKRSKAKGYHGQEGIKIPTAEEMAAELAKKMVPLETLLIPSSDPNNPSKTLIDNEERWKQISFDRWAIGELPEAYKNSSNPSWRRYYLENNISELISSLPDRPDFAVLYKNLQISAPYVTSLDIKLIGTQKIKSGSYYLAQTLKFLNNLEKLKITRGSDPSAVLSLEGLRELTKGLQNTKSKLHTLIIANCGIVGTSAVTAKLVTGLVAVPTLTTLDVSYNLLRTDGVRGVIVPLLWDHKSLTQLNLVSCDIDSQGSKELADSLLVNKKIHKLNLSKNRMDSTGMKAVIYNLAFSPCIEELTLTQVDLGAASGYPELTDPIAKMFKISSTLKKVNFWKTAGVSQAFGAGAIQALGENRSVTELDLSQIGALTSGQIGLLADSLTQNKTLKTLNLDTCGITGEGIETFYKSLFKQKKKSQEESKDVVKGSGSKEEAAKRKADKAAKRRDLMRMELVESIPTENAKKEAQDADEFRFSLENLILQNNYLSTGGKTLGKVLMIAQSLITLNLEQCSLGADAGETMGIALEGNVNLKVLNLKRNHLGKEGCRLLCEGLKANSCLENLDLSGNGIGTTGARAIARVLEEPGCVLKNLNLFGNFIDVPGIDEISKALKKRGETGKLVEIDLGMNRIRDRGAKLFGEAVRTMKTLTKIGLKLNFIKGTGIRAFVEDVVASNNKIEFISISGNGIDDESMVWLSKRLATKSINFDLKTRIAMLDPERSERTIWVTPLPPKITQDQVKKQFYDMLCGEIESVSIYSHKRAGTKKEKFAFVEFAHKNSVDLALDRKSIWVDKKRVNIYRVGSGNKRVNVNEEEEQGGPPTRGGRGRGGIRGRGSGGRGGRGSGDRRLRRG